ncbi:7-carboxy-7-deazaguanine synthase QueE [Pyrodictium abyssi]|uniref:7-carboxy-7-deazaguanine synthase QueE n=1 Tax=Pyrodictium abyssi TaxID=54256 RepID=UPI0030C74336
MSRSARPPSSASSTSPRLRVVEVFASLQGEGPFTGSRSVFIRLAGCDLRCPFCDTVYSLDPRAGRPVDVEELARVVEEERPSLVVVTGGEPLLQRRGVNELARLLAGRGYRVQLETNGTLPAPEPGEPLYQVYHVVSPKDVPVAVEGARLHPSWVEASRSTGRVWFKFLASSEEHVEAVARYVEEKGIPWERVYVMPLTREGMSPEELLGLHRRVARLALDHGFNFSPRLHLLLGLR